MKESSKLNQIRFLTFDLKEERIEGEHKIVLYQIFSFYVELYYHMEFNVLRRLKSFSSVELLDAYLNQFDLNDSDFVLP